MSSSLPIPDPYQPPRPNEPMAPTPEPPRNQRWKKIALWVGGSLLGLILLLVATGAALLQSQRVHDYILALIQQKASEQLNTKVRIQNYVLHLPSLSVDVYGVTVHGAEPYPDPPILQLQHANVGVRILSVFGRKWYLDNVQLDSPVVYVYTDAQGNSNIPKVKSSGGGKKTDIFDLGIRHTKLSQGVILYNDKKAKLDADLQYVDFRAGFDATQKKYFGHLGYTEGQLAANNLQTISHGLQADFDALPSTFHLTSAQLTIGKSKLNLRATLDNYSDPSIQATYDAAVEGDDLRRILKSNSLPQGLIQTSGSARYHALPQRPFLDAVELHGTLSSKQLDLQTDAVRIPIRTIATQYSLVGGNASIPSLKAQLLGGTLSAAASMKELTGNTKSQLSANLNGVSLSELRGMLRNAAMPREIAVRGGLNAQLNADWGKTLDDMVAKADVLLNGTIAGSGANPKQAASIPLNSAIHGEYRGGTQQVALRDSYLRMPQTTLNMNGVMSKRSRLALQLHSNDLQEIATLIDLFRAPKTGETPQPLSLAGNANFQGTLEGSVSAPHLAGQLTAANLRVKGTSWKLLRTGVDLTPSMATFQNGQLQPASQGNITFRASAGLRKWSYTENSPLQVELNATQLNVADLTNLANTNVPVSGILNANIKMHGTQLHPYGDGNISLLHSTVYEEPLNTAQLTFSGTGDEVRGHLTLGSLAGAVQSDVTIRPQDKTYTAQVTADDLHVERLQNVKARNLEATGVINLNASGHGSFQDPQLQASVQSARLEIRKQAITGINLQLNVAHHMATANLISHVVNTVAQAQAKVNLTGDYPIQATLDTQPIPLQTVAAIYLPAQAGNISGQTEVHATLNGPLKNKKLLEGHIRVPQLQMNYTNTIQLASVSPILADYRDGVLNVQRGTIRGTDTDLQFQGSIPTGGNTPMSVLLLGTVNLHLAQLFDPNIRSGGQLRFNINSYGGTNDPNVQGKIEVVNASFARGDLPVGLQRGNGVLTLTKNRLNITKFEGSIGGGTVTAQGGVTYQPKMQFDLGVSAKEVRLLYPQGVRESVNADLRLSGNTDNALLGGNVTISDLSFTQAFDLMNFINQFTGGIKAPPSRGVAQNIQLNIGVRSDNNVNLVSRTLSINGTANLQVRGTAAQPVLLGRVNLASGDLIFNGNRFVLNGGTIQFVNPSETQPVVNLSLNTNIQQYNIYMRFNGPVNQLRTNYSSDPSLPAADIINLLAFGKTTEANQYSTTPTNQAAQSLIASQVSSQITSRVSKIAGISQLSINPVLNGGTSQGPAGANITIQQRVTGNLFVTFSSNVASTQNQTIQGQYQVTPRVAVSVTRNQNGGVAVDTLIKKTW